MAATGLALATVILGVATPAGATAVDVAAPHQVPPTTTTVPAPTTTTVAPATTTTTVAPTTTTTEAVPEPTATPLEEPDSGDLNYWVLLGVAVIVVGFLLKIDAIAVVIIAAAVTALVYGASFGDFLEVIGQSFVDNRTVSFFILTLPMIALSERFGLKEQAVNLIRRMRNVTAPRFLFLYTIIRQLCGVFGIRISGMVQFVRPIVQPMSSAAAGEAGLLSEKNDELIKAEAAKAENVGNFFGQNGFVAASGVLLIVGTLEGLGYDVQPDQVVVASLPIIFVATFFSFLNSRALASRLKAGAGGAPAARTTEGGSDV
ncbi:MAG: 5-oxoproline transporter, DUF969 family subunit [Acidimicrobiales bacterium]